MSAGGFYSKDQVAHSTSMFTLIYSCVRSTRHSTGHFPARIEIKISSLPGLQIPLPLFDCGFTKLALLLLLLPTHTNSFFLRFIYISV